MLNWSIIPQVRNVFYRITPIYVDLHAHFLVNLNLNYRQLFLIIRGCFDSIFLFYISCFVPTQFLNDHERNDLSLKQDLLIF